MYKKGDIYKCEVAAEVLDEVDVLVAGGGTAGVTAALAAARNGAKTMLVERNGSLGGMLTYGNAGITMFTKFSGKADEHVKDMEILKRSPEELHIVGGITMEIAQRLLDSGIGIGNEGAAGSYVFTSSENFKRLLFQMMREAGVKLRLHSWVTDVVKEENELHGVVVESKSGRQMIPAKQFIDTTGDGDMAARAGVSYTVGITEQDICAKSSNIGEMTATGVMFTVGNTVLEKTFAWLESNPEHFEIQNFARFSLKEVKEYFSRGENATFKMQRKGETPNVLQVYNLPQSGVVTLCCPCVHGIDGCNVEDLTRAEVVMAKMLERWMHSIKTIPGFENAFLMQVPDIGVRETRHIQGEYVLDLMDIYKQKKFEDSIGLGSHPVDSYPQPEWLSDHETAYPPHWYFQIPFRTMIPKGIDNLLVAGRCISATHEAFGCIRSTVQCMITGEAAGTAASLCVKKLTIPRDLDIKLLQKTLKLQGVLL